MFFWQKTMTSMRKIATVQLESLGIDVVRAMNGKNALQIFETRTKAALTLS